MVWTKKQIGQHKQAGVLLGKIKDDVFKYIQTHSSCNEYEVQQFVLKRFKEEKLRTAIAGPIVAFRSSTSDFHYDPPSKGSRRLKQNSLIMLDIWAGFNVSATPFADATFMAYYGKNIPVKIQKVFDIVIMARDASVSLLRTKLRKKELPTGGEVDGSAMKTLTDAGYRFRLEIQHGTGHSIGTTSPHGRYGAVSVRNKNKLKKNLGYTIEPGLYFDRKFGVRSEIDCYVDSAYKLQVTTPVQKKLPIL